MLSHTGPHTPVATAEIFPALSPKETGPIGKGLVRVKSNIILSCSTSPSPDGMLSNFKPSHAAGFDPPIQRVTILAINLPDPGTFGPYDSYTATLLTNGTEEPLAVLELVPTIDQQNWLASTLLDFGGTLPNISVEVRPVGFNHIGPVILEGQVFD